MAKRKYKDIKHADKFSEVLSNVWDRLDPYAWHIGITMGILVVIVGFWLLVGSYFTGRSDRPWAKLFEIKESYVSVPEEAAEQMTRELLAELAKLTKDYRGQSVAAISLIDLSQASFGFAATLREHNALEANLAAEKREEIAKEARSYLAKSVEAAKEFIADFPRHPLLSLAHYNAGKAHFELGNYEEAAKHFKETRSTARVDFLKTLANWHEGRCYEHLGRLDEARQRYEAVRQAQHSAWCSEMADFRLTQLGAAPAERP